MLRTCPGKPPGTGDGIRLGLGAGADSLLGLALGRGGGSISRELAARLGDLEPGAGGTSPTFWGLGCRQAPCERRWQLRPSPKRRVVGFWVGRRWVAGAVSFLGAGVVCFCVTLSSQPRMGTLQTCRCVVVFCFGLRPSGY